MNPAGPNASPRLWIGIAQSCEVAPEELARIATHLEPHDSRRFRNFGSEKRRREFLLGRWILMQSSLEWLGQAGADLAFDSTPNGAVGVANGMCQPSLAASLSHTGYWVACALVSGNASSTGIDIESMRERDYPAMDEMAFPPGKYTPLHLLPAERRRDEFYLRWTRHEACFKATGSTLHPSPCHQRSLVVHDSLMLSVCITGLTLSPGRIRIMEWQRNRAFRSCADTRSVSPFISMEPY